MEEQLELLDMNYDLFCVRWYVKLSINLSIDIMYVQSVRLLNCVLRGVKSGYAYAYMKYDDSCYVVSL